MKENKHINLHQYIYIAKVNFQQDASPIARKKSLPIDTKFVTSHKQIYTSESMREVIEEFY